MAHNLRIFLQMLEQSLDNFGVSDDDLNRWNRELLRGKELGDYQEKARSPKKRIPKYLEKPVEQLASMRRLLGEDVEPPSTHSFDL
jgi:hypothetical protein